MANTYTDYTLEVGVYTEIAKGTGLYYISEKTYDGLSCIVLANYSRYYVLGSSGDLVFKVSETVLSALSTSNSFPQIRVRKLAQK